MTTVKGKYRGELIACRSAPANAVYYLTRAASYDTGQVVACLLAILIALPARMRVAAEPFASYHKLCPISEPEER